MKISTQGLPRYDYSNGIGMHVEASGRYLLADDVEALGTEDGAVIMSAAEALRLMRDSVALDWLQDQVTHLEHGQRSDEDAYWPHTPDDVAPFVNFAGLTLREYIARRQAGERGRHADPEPVYEPGLCAVCNGSGEGACADAICHACHGVGEVMRRAA